LHRDYKIEIGLTPHFHNNKNFPYYWTIFCFYDTWCNEGTGWAKTPTEAWNAAMKYYKDFKESQNI